MPYRKKEIEKVYYRIGEVAEMFGVNVSLIRYWEKEFDIIKPFRNKKGNRFFTKQDVDNFHLIYHLVKERGFTLQGAREKLKANRDDVTANHEVVKTLQQMRAFLLELKQNLSED
ncbi:MAG: MerR family transcriptional regulator [Lentimicrobium sp.]|jgi:DNA-binding transcriptional MerR regulator|uniref:MerR family transcriptional regulator n=1 Tax=Lentimicrobium sp. TaxID=2034841 RepID=UPI000ED4FA07|nr:MerR family transcriptional regulator [Lentimicrobium sp.]MEA5110072.1 MerR family transcriptional regulator [Lentimicrobium sp.]HCT71924.1 MerR family transcriptional regulator [Bacteroidales bacterium]